ncbi:MAG: hypothetical protein KGO49_14240 [Gammaproteobacteria bacterium]|nr:hypothetical protein [Gammaproteobacteria bacterium]
MSAHATGVICNSGYFQIENTFSRSSSGDDTDSRPQIIMDQGKTSDAVDIVIRGPMLGVESNDFKAVLICTEGGIKISANIIPNPNYEGAQTASYLWQPIIKVKAILYRPDLEVVSIWHQSSVGRTTVDRLMNFLHYPVTIRKTFYLSKYTEIKH